MMTQKEIVKILDRAAARCGDAGASSKQTWFLAGLMLREFAGDAEQLDRELSDYVLGASLNRGLASALIDGALATLNRAA